MKKTNIGLCYRCEYRARYLESGAGPRMECQEPTSTVHSCYMFSPIKPVILARNQGDRRSLNGPPLLAARAHAVCIPRDLNLTYMDTKRGKLKIWTTGNRWEL